jgi:hypothetical protein
MCSWVRIFVLARACVQLVRPFDAFVSVCAHGVLSRWYCVRVSAACDCPSVSFARPRAQWVSAMVSSDFATMRAATRVSMELVLAARELYEDTNPPSARAAVAAAAAAAAAGGGGGGAVAGPAGSRAAAGAAEGKDGAPSDKAAAAAAAGAAAPAASGPAANAFGFAGVDIPAWLRGVREERRRLLAEGAQLREAAKVAGREGEAARRDAAAARGEAEARAAALGVEIASLTASLEAARRAPPPPSPSGAAASAATAAALEAATAEAEELRREVESAVRVRSLLA